MLCAPQSQTLPQILTQSSTYTIMEKIMNNKIIWYYQTLSLTIDQPYTHLETLLNPEAFGLLFTAALKSSPPPDAAQLDAASPPLLLTPVSDTGVGVLVAFAQSGSPYWPLMVVWGCLLFSCWWFLNNWLNGGAVRGDSVSPHSRIKNESSVLQQKLLLNYRCDIRSHPCPPKLADLNLS